MEMVSNWLRNNLLTMNVQKTKYINFCIKATTLPKNPLAIKIHSSTCSRANTCSCPDLSQTKQIRYLGVILDDHLNWKDHIKNLTGRTRKLIYVFKQLRHVMNFQKLSKIYCALAQSILTYCIRAWGRANKTNLIILERAQRALIKVMKFKPRRFATAMLYKESSLLTIRQLFIKAVIMEQHSLVNPEVLESQKRRRKDRVFTNCPSSKTQFGSKSIANLGPRLYNNVSKHTRIIQCTHRQLNQTLKEYLGKLNYDDTEKLIDT